jgi:hypothetical protein
MALRRKNRSTVRHWPGGKIRRVRVADPREVALARRIRERMRKDASHEWAGFPLGILYLTGEIGEADYEAGRSFAALHARHARIMGLASPACRAIDWHGSEGRAIGREPGAEEIRAIRRKLAEAERVIVDNAGRQGLQALEETCLLDREPQNPFLLKRCLGILSRSTVGEL